jgi:L-alanine-DL-glutamate epimerase-like enolase superfamily enzyme
MDSYHHFEKRPPRVVRGRIALPEGAGFGIELDPAKVESSTAVRWN